MWSSILSHIKMMKHKAVSETALIKSGRLKTLGLESIGNLIYLTFYKNFNYVSHSTSRRLINTD